MGNWLTRFVWPGTQRIHDEAPPMARKDVGFTHSVDVRDRSNRSDLVEQNSVASEGLERYNYDGTTSLSFRMRWNSIAEVKQFVAL